MVENIKIIRVLGKTLILLVLFVIVLFPLIHDDIGKLSLYNLVYPGRTRFPYSDDPSQSYNLSLFNIEANFASHVVSEQTSPGNEYRVFVFGDSSVWGTLLKPDETLVGQLNQKGLETLAGEPVHFYNLGYPTLSLTKDLFFIANALIYHPDLIVWFVTLESFPYNKQLSSPIIANNYLHVSSMIKEYDIDLNLEDESFVKSSYLDETIIGQRRNLADILRLQLYGVMWAVTGIDQVYPADFEKAKRDFDEDSSFHGWEDGELTISDLAYPILASGHEVAGNIPLLVVNEPILIGDGENSDLRYNFYYPIWAYDQYRQTLLTTSTENNWNYIDLWDLVPGEYFTNTAIHSNPEGVGLIAAEISEPILELIEEHPKRDH